MRFSFCFLYSSAQHHQTRTQTKKRWGPALGLWQGLVALARAKLRKQQLKIRSHKEKQNYQPQHGTNKSRCIKTKQQSKKPHADKTISRTAVPHINPKKQRASNLHAAIDR